MTVTKSTNTTRSSTLETSTRTRIFELGDFHVTVGYANPFRLTSLTDDEVVEVKIGFLNGFSQAELARNYGVTDGTIWNIVHGRTWRHIFVVQTDTGLTL